MQQAKPFDPAELSAATGGDWQTIFRTNLNNFAMHFPLGDIPVKTGNHEGLYRDSLRSLQWWDKKYVDVMDPEECRPYTELRCQQTTAEFYKILDRTVIDEFGIQMDRVSEAVNRAYKAELTPEQKEEAFHAMYDLLLPIYIAMRKKGYNHFDLRG